MSLFKNFGVGFSSYGKAIELLFTKGLIWYMVFPLLLNILFLVAGWLGIGSLTEWVENWLQNAMKIEDNSFFGAEYLTSVSTYISTVASGFVWVVMKFIFFFVFAYFGGYIVLICLSPVFAFLSEKTEEILTGNKYKFNGDQMMRDVVRGILLALRNLFIELFYMIIIFFLGLFIPLLGGIIGGVLLFFISSYFYGFSFIDYTNERRRMKLKESVKFIRANKGLAIANGMVFSFMLLIPFCGTTLAGFVAIISVIAATVATHKVVDLSDNPYAQKQE
ncbi:MAG: EI24 domain-containing protein [Vicingaceae bacterium]|nr:EI24 domain-containing protein [Vicingaceae bacterium]